MKVALRHNYTAWTHAFTC